MTVTVDYFGRTGNNLFQYAMARLMAIHTRFNLKTQWCNEDFIESTQFTWNDIAKGDVINFTDDDFISPKIAMSYERPIHLHGYFQRKQHVHIYNEHREVIKGFWKLPRAVKDTDDIVIHLRLTDYWWYRNDCVISPVWYHKILGKERFDKLYIVVEPHVTNAKYLRNFQQYKPIIVSKSPREDFHFIRQFDRIICSNSTFCWWAAFLSEASKIWTFARWMGKENNLAQIAGAKVVPGDFIKDRYLSGFDWSDYWNKPPEYFKRRG